MQAGYRHELSDDFYQEPIHPIAWLILAGPGVAIGLAVGVWQGWW